MEIVPYFRSLFGGESQQKLLFVPNADTNPEKDHEISEAALFRFLLNEETKEQSNEIQVEVAEMLNYLSDIDKLSKITEFETHRSSMGARKDFFKAFHVFIVFKTTSKKDGDFWWSLEKNMDYIVLQRSRNKNAVKDKCYGKERNEVQPIKENLKGKGSIRNLFAIVWVYKIIEEKYHIMNSNCQSLVTLVSKQITEIEYEYEGYFTFSLRENDRTTEMLDFINLLTNAFGNKCHPLFSMIFHEDTNLFDTVMKSGEYDIDDPIILDGLTPLNLAIMLSKTKMVQHLLDKWRTDPIKSDKQSKNVLHLALQFAKENTDIIDLLLAHEKVDINERDKRSGWTALHIAIPSCNTIAVKHLLDKGANPNICDKNGRSPLHFAARCGADTEIIDLILKVKNNKGIDGINDEYGITALHMAAGASNEITAEYLIKKGADLNYRDKNGRTPLHLAAQFAKDMKIIDLLLTNIKEEDVDRYNKDGEFLICANSNENGLEGEITDRLKDKGIFGKRKDPVLAEKSDKTLSKEETENNQSIDLVKIFQTTHEKLQDDGYRNVSDEEMSQLLLNKAILDSDVEKVLNLIEKETDISKMTWEGGINALHAASKYAKTTELIDIILENGKFDINAGDNKGRTPLHYAFDGDNSTINARHLIEKGTDPTVRNNKGITPLHVAALRSKETDILDLLLANEKVDINERNENGMTALHLVIANSNVTTVRYLIEKGANPTIADENGWTSLHLAAIFVKDMEIVELLLNHKDVNVNCFDNKGRNALDYARHNQHGLGELIANQLKEKGAMEKIKEKTIDRVEQFKKLKKFQNDWCENLRKASEVNSFLTDDKVPNEIKIKKMLPKVLGSAIEDSNVGKVRDLIGNGLDISKVTWEEKKKEVNALQAASKCAKTTELMDVILETDQFDINGGDNDGNTPIHYAMDGDNPTINVRHLIEEKGADPAIANANGITPLHLVAFNEKIVDLSLIDLILENKHVDINASDNKNGWTALHYAIDKNNVNVARHLLDKGADPTIRDKKEKTPLQLAGATASLTKDTTILQLLLANKNVNVDERYEFGLTALHMAVMKSNVTIARCLIENGANPNIASKYGWTPLHVAARCAKDMDIVEFLLSHKDVDVNYLDNMGRNALYYTKDNEHGIGEAIANRLKEKGAVDTEVEIFEICVHNKRRGGAGQIKDSSQDSQILTERDEVDLMASKALQDAIINSDVERVRILIETGLDFSKPKWGEKGMNALHLASSYAMTAELINVILETGKFDINGGDYDGQTPLHYAIKGDNPTINARHLIEKGADPNIPDKNRVIPLQLAAAEAKTIDLIELFLNSEMKVDVNHCDNQGNNALVHALLNEHGLRDIIIPRLKERGAKEF